MVLSTCVPPSISIRWHMCINRINIFLYHRFIDPSKSCISVWIFNSREWSRMLKISINFFFFLVSHYRMARMEAAAFVGLLLGSLCCGPLYNATSASFVFFCAAVSTFCGLVLVYFFVQESIQCSTSDIYAWVRHGQMIDFRKIHNFNRQKFQQTKFKDLFDAKHVIDMFRTAFKKRDGFDRTIIWLTMLMSGAHIFIMGTLNYARIVWKRSM